MYATGSNDSAMYLISVSTELSTRETPSEAILVEVPFSYEAISASISKITDLCLVTKILIRSFSLSLFISNLTSLKYLTKALELGELCSTSE